ncbi:DUF6607 family protein [Wenyingzhuangia aestuarii]|uniref:DUF6607 family protein n=1 Tax=Wenyingzhuangia aestuarii TaxID=1647582 RepID=UPI00143ACC81|nr:DUF6607 family protein [Wenyingzhuangia aestuarii]NJB83699.1 hypothetical protein [Wenyingzhuangia aestuarii]
MNKFLITSLMLCFSLAGNVQAQKKKDREAIKEMCGCFEVSFNFAETFNYSKDSLYQPSKTKQNETALEWAQLVKDDKNHISIQHLLQVGDPNKPFIVKHWRQDWLYQNRDFYVFNGDREWNFKEKSKKEVNNQWTQKVYQVDDSPRYEGSGSWVHVDGKTYWESTTTAPLPRREYTKRSDYNITLRGNRQEITKTGWVHDQDNAKVIREKGKEDIIIAHEKGYNVYTKVADEKCQAAQDWWTKNKDKWAVVRAKWDQVYSRNKDVHLEAKVNNKLLYKYLFSDEYQSQEKISKIIEDFVK